MEMRLIDADALIKTLEVANEALLRLTGGKTELCLYGVIQIIKDMPAIEQGHRNARMGIRRPTYYQQNYCFSQERARGAVLGRGKREC